MNMNTHITLDFTNAEVRTINGVARTCREFCGMLRDNTQFIRLRKDLDTIIDKCERALDDQVKVGKE